MGFVTPYSRMKDVWATIREEAIKEPGGLRFKAELKAERIEISDGQSSPIAVPLALWGSLADEFIIHFKSAVNQLLSRGSADEFPAERLWDDYSPHAIHKQEHNATWLTIMRNSIRSQLFISGESKHGLFKDGKIDRLAAEKWLALEKDVLANLAGSFALTAGLGVDSWQYKNFRYDSTEFTQRNVWILKNGTIILGDPLARMRENEISCNIFALAPDLSRHSLFYLTIIRPIACEILSIIQKDAPLYQSEIWAHTVRHPRAMHQWRWSGPEVSELLTERTFATFGFALTPSIIRQIVRQVFRAEYPFLFRSCFNSIVDLQAQHHGKTSIFHYGRLTDFPFLKNVRADQPTRYLTVCQIWQAAIGVGQINEAWRRTISTHNAFCIDEHDSLMLDKARGLVNIYYNIRNGVSSEDASKILQLAPFLYGTKTVRLPLFSLH